MKSYLKQYFNFSKKESIACVSLSIIILIVAALPYYYKTKVVEEPINKEFEAIANTAIANLDSIELIEAEERKSKYQKFKTEEYTLNPFQFDPNTIDENGLNKLGLPQKFIKTFLNFRNKGAKFYKPEDFKRVWGLREEDANTLLPYIVIANKNEFDKSKSFINKFQKPTPQIIDINTADVNAFRILPLVGNVAYKIVKYREKLGGFLNINQVREAYEVTDSMFIVMKPFLKLESTQLNKLNINTANDFELAGHPYIEKNIAKAIVIYRTQHGNYKSVQDIKKIIFIKKELVDKIAPYLTVE